MDCPKCGAGLHNSARYCGCGWKKQFQSNFQDQKSVPCAHENCGIAAMCRIKTKTGIANLCWQHYDRYFADQAYANLDKYGLAREPDETNAEWVERMRQFVRTGFKRFADRQQQKRAA